MTTDTEDTVPVLSPLKMFQLPMSNPISY